MIHRDKEKTDEWMNGRENKKKKEEEKKQSTLKDREFKTFEHAYERKGGGYSEEGEGGRKKKADVSRF